MSCWKNEEDMIQNLKDAGCNEKQIKELIELYRKGEEDAICKKLQIHRNNILDNVHKSEKEISCVDYFIYNVKKEKGNDKNE